MRTTNVVYDDFVYPPPHVDKGMELQYPCQQSKRIHCVNRKDRPFSVVSGHQKDTLKTQ